MRRLLLPFLLAVTAAAAPAAAEPDGFLCAGAWVSGDRVVGTATGVHCVAEDYRYTVWCEDNTADVDSAVRVRVWVCVPGY